MPVGGVEVTGGDDATAWLFDILVARRAPSACRAAGGGSAQLLCRHAVVPTSTRGRFLVPIDTRAAAAGSMSAYNRLRSWRSRVPRAALAALVRTGAGRRLLRSRTEVHFGGGSPDELAEGWLVEHLRRELGEPALSVAAGLRTGDTFAKPVLQLFRPDGSPVGYAKVGWNDVTVPRVRTEAAVLAGWPADRSPGVAVPRLLYAGEWAGRFVSVTAPLPARARRLRRRDASPALASSAVFEAHHTTTGDLLGSTYWASLVADAGRAGQTTARSAPALERLLERLAHDSGDAELRFGRWHGDWVTWNLAVADGRLWAWDWEYSDASVPVGFDVVHHLFQEDFVGRAQPVDAALRASAAAGVPLLRTLGLDDRAARTTVALHRAELLRRDATAEASGGRPDPRLDQDALSAAVA